VDSTGLQQARPSNLPAGTPERYYKPSSDGFAEALNRLNSFTIVPNYLNRGVMASPQLKGTSQIDGATYTYDFGGNRTSKTNLLNSAASNFSYDSTYQLTGVTGMNPESYTYDPVGNRLSSQLAATYSYNNSNEVTAVGSITYTYDDNGNTPTKSDASGTTTYSWDFENRLVSAQLPSSSTVNFKYDPFGRRIEKGISVFAYDGANLIEESDTGGIC
jgi:YD repeat-containing protein